MTKLDRNTIVTVRLDIRDLAQLTQFYASQGASLPGNATTLHYALQDWLKCLRQTGHLKEIPPSTEESIAILNTYVNRETVLPEKSRNAVMRALQSEAISLERNFSVTDTAAPEVSQDILDFLEEPK